MADAFAEELLTDGGDIGDDEIFQELQEIFQGDGALLSTAGLNGGSCWNPTGPGLTAGLAAFASTPCMPRGLPGGFAKCGGRWSRKTVRCGSRQALAQHGRETTQIARPENLSFQMLKDGMREDTVDFNTLRKPTRQEMNKHH